MVFNYLSQFNRAANQNLSYLRMNELIPVQGCTQKRKKNIYIYILPVDRGFVGANMAVDLANRTELLQRPEELGTSEEETMMDC